MAFKDNSKMPSQRQLRVGEQLRQALSEIFLLESIYLEDNTTISVTVSEVRVSPDLKNATAYILPLGGVVPEGFLELLNKSAPYFRKLIGKKVRLKYSPNLTFKQDDSFDNAMKLNELIKSSEETDVVQ